VFDELSSRLATALLPSGEKQDIMGVAQRIEHLAEHIEKAARALLVAEPLALPEELASDLAELAARTRRCVDALALAAAQHRDLPTFMAHAHEVSRAEREAEDASMAILASAVERRGMGVAEELLLRELLLRFEGIADQADAAVDALRILALKR
jgi:uncharacterized protein Yka (UPF0111/DUF47 family)